MGIICLRAHSVWSPLVTFTFFFTPFRLCVLFLFYFCSIPISCFMLLFPFGSSLERIFLLLLLLYTVTCFVFRYSIASWFGNRGRRKQVDVGQSQSLGFLFVFFFSLSCCFYHLEHYSCIVLDWHRWGVFRIRATAYWRRQPGFYHYSFTVNTNFDDSICGTTVFSLDSFLFRGTHRHGYGRIHLLKTHFNCFTWYNFCRSFSSSVRG